MTPEESATFTKGLEAAKDYADCIVKPPLEQFGELLADRVGLWRLKNRVKVLLEAKRYCEAKGIDPAKLLPAVFVPLIEEAGNTDDEKLSDMFARLLATHLDPNRQSDVHPAFAKVMGQLSPLDAKVLEIIDDGSRKVSPSKKSPNRDAVWVVEKAGATADPRPVILSLTNLDRLGLATKQGTTALFPLNPSQPTSVIDMHVWRVTQFGHRFLSAVSKNPNTYWRNVEEAEMLAAMKQVKTGEVKIKLTVDPKLLGHKDSDSVSTRGPS